MLEKALCLKPPNWNAMGETANIIWYLERKHVATEEQLKGQTRWCVWLKETSSDFYYMLDDFSKKQDALAYAKTACQEIAKNKQTDEHESVDRYFTDPDANVRLFAKHVTNEIVKALTVKAK